MSELHENALLILRHMLEEGLISPKGISPAKLREAVGFNHDEFGQAEHFLLQGHFIDEGGSGENGIRRLTDVK